LSTKNILVLLPSPHPAHVKKSDKSFFYSHAAQLREGPRSGTAGAGLPVHNPPAGPLFSSPATASRVSATAETLDASGPPAAHGHLAICDNDGHLALAVAEPQHFLHSFRKSLHVIKNSEATIAKVFFVSIFLSLEIKIQKKYA
jgi:hypothetical protein